VGGTVTAVWAASTVVDMLIERYDPPSGLGTLMLVVASALFAKPVAEELRRRVINGSDDG
jgi:hypothetical protein